MQPYKKQNNDKDMKAIYKLVFITPKKPMIQPPIWQLAFGYGVNGASPQ